ncbi:MAG: hypothetical protein N2255_02345, partial [Kiritimatiellae bacterium]|nr:hypothetical protein [Kiritimatiellia bacterium]
NVQLFEQVIRAGVTVSAGSAGGAHETNSSWWDNLVFHHLMFTGREFGEATLRSMPYLDWTICLVGDPLYSPDLSRTTRDTTPPRVANSSDIRLKVADCGGGKQALRVETRLANIDPEMAEIRVVCRPRSGHGRVVVGENTRFSARPCVDVTGLEPDTEYAVAVILKDPYGKIFDSEKSFGPLIVKTGLSREGTVLWDHSFSTQESSRSASIVLSDTVLDESGEIDLYFATEGRRDGAIPVVRAADGRIIFGPQWGLRIGGARTGLGSRQVLHLEPNRDWHIRLRWRRYPVTREVYLVARDGSHFLVAAANDLPWNPADGIGTNLLVTAECRLQRVIVRNQAPCAPPEHRACLPRRFDWKEFQKHDGR